MPETKLEIVIQELPDGKFHIINDFPPTANAALISNHLGRISSDLLEKIVKKVDQVGFSSNDYIALFANSLRIKDLIG